MAESASGPFVRAVLFSAIRFRDIGETGEDRFVIWHVRGNGDPDMNPLFAAVISSTISSKRKWPTCGISQVVPKDKSKAIVTCKSCGAEILPPGKIGWILT
jgi:hypothetical protein